MGDTGGRTPVNGVPLVEVGYDMKSLSGLAACMFTALKFLGLFKSYLNVKKFPYFYDVSTFQLVESPPINVEFFLVDYTLYLPMVST